MKNVKLIVEYDGTNYCGFQKQKRGKTIQAELEKAASKLFSQCIRVISSGRTDSGVHAKGHVVNFHVKKKLSIESILKGMNSYLPHDIVVKSARYVASSFHAQYSAVKKQYRYVVWNDIIRSPLCERYSLFYPYSLDLKLMQEAAQLFIGTHDFKSFSSKSAQKDNTIRTIYMLAVRKKGNKIVFTIEGNGFLYNMVRNIVGTILLVGRGKIKMGEIKKIFSAKDRSAAGPTVAARGLSLIKVVYGTRKQT